MPDLCGKTLKVKNESYNLTKVVGRGTFGTVYEGIGPDKKKFAVKVVHEFKTLDAATSLVNELNIMRNLCHLHPNLNSLLSVDYINEVGCAIILEYAEGGNLYTATRQGLMNDESRFRVFWQIVSAIDFLHSHNVCHRDIKPENILLSGPEMEMAMLADFGFAKVVDRCGTKTSCGSAHYVAPEVLKGSYNPFIADMWSLGVVLYAMYALRLPFLGKSVHETLEASAAGRYTIPNRFSADLADLVGKMICLETSKRITAKEIMGHKWWKEQCEKFRLNQSGPNDRDSVESFATVTTPDIMRVEQHIGEAWQLALPITSPSQEKLPGRAETYAVRPTKRLSIFKRVGNFFRRHSTKDTA